MWCDSLQAVLNHVIFFLPWKFNCSILWRRVDYDTYLFTMNVVKKVVKVSYEVLKHLEPTSVLEILWK